jgi:transposase
MTRVKLQEQNSKNNETELEEYENYIAVDWSKANMAIARLSRNSAQPRVFERQADIEELKTYLRGLKGKTIVTVEETTTAHWLYLELHDAVDRILICDPYRNKLLSDGPKTDKIDAAKLCERLRAGLLKEVFHTDDELYELRRLISAYDDLIVNGVRSLNRRYSLLQGVGPTDKRGISAKDFILKSLESSIGLYQEVKQEYEKKFEWWCKRNRLLKALLDVNGIGTIGAVKILATVIDAKRFPDTGHYLAYCGLVKTDKISGNRSYGKRTPRYSRILKSVYKTAAVTALQGENQMRGYYDYLIGKGVAEHNARNTVARYIAKVTYGMLKSGEKYQPYKWREQQKQTVE